MDAVLRLQAIEPDNALVWAVFAGGAQRAAGEAEAEAACSAAGYAKPYLDLYRFLHGAFRDVTMPPESEALHGKLGSHLWPELYPTEGDMLAIESFGRALAFIW